MESVDAYNNSHSDKLSQVLLIKKEKIMKSIICVAQRVEYPGPIISLRLSVIQGGIAVSVSPEVARSIERHRQVESVKVNPEGVLVVRLSQWFGNDNKKASVGVRRGQYQEVMRDLTGELAFVIGITDPAIEVSGQPPKFYSA